MNIEKKMLSLVAEPHTRFPPLASVIRKFRITADAGKPNETDTVLANPPFNDSDTALRACAFTQSEVKMQVVSEAKDNFRKDDDVRWQFGVPPKGNANFAWVQLFIHCIRRSLGEGGHLAPQGMAVPLCGIANGPAVAGSSNQSGEGDPAPRDRALIEADLVDCMVALPGQLFYSTQIPVCLWFIREKQSGKQFQPCWFV